jgi:cobalt/nickel transport system ATP-binding protein
MEFERVRYRYPGQAADALDGLTLALPAGEKIALLGRNGSGKSTLFLHCNGLYRPGAGVVRFAGRPLSYDRASLRRLRQQVGIVFQSADDQLFSASVAQDISFGPLNLGLSEVEARRRVTQAAELCEVAGLLERPTHALSGGEKARVALAGVLAMEPKLLIADELIGTLDPWARRHILGIFERLHATKDKTILLATHSLSVARDWASFIVLLEAGRALFAGPAERLFAERTVLEQTGLAEVWGLDHKASAICPPRTSLSL